MSFWLPQDAWQLGEQMEGFNPEHYKQEPVPVTDFMTFEEAKNYKEKIRKESGKL